MVAAPNSNSRLFYHGGGGGRCDAVEVLGRVESGLVLELDEVAALGEAADVVAAVLAGQRRAGRPAHVLVVGRFVDRDRHARETGGALVRDRARDVVSHSERRVDAGGDLGRVHMDVAGGVDRHLALVVLGSVGAGVVAEPDAVVTGCQAEEDVAAAGGVGRGDSDSLPATPAVGAVGRDIDATEGTTPVRLRDRAGDAAGQREHGIDAGGRRAGAHRDVIGSRRSVVVEPLGEVGAGVVAELDAVVARGQAVGDLVVALGVGQHGVALGEEPVVTGAVGAVGADADPLEADAV